MTRIAIVGLGGMGRALAGRLLEVGHEVAVWNRTAARADELVDRGAHRLGTPDDAGRYDAVVVCLADDASVLAVAAPDGAARAAWSECLVVSTSTVAPDTVTRLAGLYGDRFVAAFILGAPHAVAAGTARWIAGGAGSARRALRSLWDAFAETIEVGDDPARAAAVKLLQNQMLLAGAAVIAETVRLGRSAGLDDDDLRPLLTTSPMVPPGLSNRVDVLLSADHSGWFTPALAAKDLAHALELGAGDAAPPPVTEAARRAYAELSRTRWADADVSALVELGAQEPGGGA